MSETLDVELGAGREDEAIDDTPSVFLFSRAARTVSVSNTGSDTLFVAVGDATSAGLLALMAESNALPIPAGSSFTFEATYPRLRALALACASGESTTATFAAY